MRCKACNAQLKPSEGRWNPVLKEHGELCTKCKGYSSPELPELDLIVPTRVPKDN